MYGRVRKIHLVGIGGSGMSGIAEILLNRGFPVSGSDQKPGETTRRLEALGAQVFEGHRASNVEGADIVVLSTAIRADNPEVVAARERGLIVIPRAEMLAELMRMKYGISIAGTHGKTTTTSMVGLVLETGALDPTVIVGGRLKVFGSHARPGAGEFFVAEADESDGTFLRLTSCISVITNIDAEHLDFWGDMDRYREAFVDFANKVPFFGLVVACIDHPEVQSILPRVTRRVRTYGFGAPADIRAVDVRDEAFGSRYRLVVDGREVAEVKLSVPGRHNVQNSLAAVAVGLELGVPVAKIVRGLERFTGVHRRFEVRGEARGVLVVDDYGHHPAEIRATLETARRLCPDRRLVVCFQPHRYSRTKALYDQFMNAFNDADVVWVLDIYPAGETATPGVNAEWLVKGLQARGVKRVQLGGTVKEASAALPSELLEGDLFLTLGAGNVHQVGDEVLAALGAQATGGTAG
ncbi:MAG: UDP-N-acetylmuramate--L-alanine ligase [Deltaproteobacteria bacterium]|nr:UDP-N-acetylmuramate--L-alanine ligase [Deltaproteobacteria bacterium]